jgi:hypothetical protein
MKGDPIMSEKDPEERKEPDSSKPARSINTGGGAYTEGNIATGGGDFVGRDKNVQSGAKPDEIAEAFLTVYNGIEKIPDPADRAEARETAHKLETEARKGEQADEKRVERWFKFLAEIGPDVMDVVTTTFTNPIAGVSKVFQKIAQRARDERQP